MTQSAQQFVAPLTFQALSGNPVHTELLDADQENAMGHINLARWADVLLVAPATANCIAKFSHGLADDLLSTLYLAATCPVVIAPAMNQAMWHKAVTQENIAKLISHGVNVIDPGEGEQACGESGFGRMAEPLEICDYLSSFFQNALSEPANLCLSGYKVLISAGPTREPLDPVRYITNRSSGKMGYALADAALRAGAEVTLVSGPVSLTAPKNAKVIKVETAEQMHTAVIENVGAHDVYIGAAAVADYRPVVAEQQKIKKIAKLTTITLSKTKDILADVALLDNPPYTVGFAAETQDLEIHAKNKLSQKKLDMIAANWVGHEEGGFDRDQNALEVFWKNGRKSLKMADKKHIAEQFIDLIATCMTEEKITHVSD
jgi:phosphopantothenoylcysteine decarboxylase/phosphopantothenate--cysteine ligase